MSSFRVKKELKKYEKTKIVTSIGPASSSVEVFKKMVEAGANVARINFSHATIEERVAVVDTVKKVRELTGINIGILYDTKGPEFRSGVTQEEGIKLVAGNIIKIVKEDVIGNEERFTVNHKSAVDALKVGDTVLLENGLMVARGDLGVEVPFEDLPNCQKRIVQVGRKYKKMVIVATEMLESMKHNPRPTRAEVTDISYAVYNWTDAIIKSVVEAANSLKAKLIVIPTISGSSAKLISNLEPSYPILALVQDEKTANSLSLNYGIYAKVVDLVNDMDLLIDIAIKESKNFMELNEGDNIIITGGLVAGKIGFTNLMKIQTI